jgi:Flp pilus assembly protein TadD
MIKGGKQKLDKARGPGARGPIRGRRPKIRQLLPGLALGRTAGKYGMASLVVLALCGTLSLGAVGCSALLSVFGWRGAGPGDFAANLRLSPEEITRLARNAHYYKLMGQPELALRELEQVHQQNPDNLKIINILAQNYEELGKFEAARQLYEEALTGHGPHPVLANNLCFSYYLEGRWQEAETCYRKTLARDPRNMAARNNLGLLYCRLGRQEAARRLWLEVEGEAAADQKVSQALAALGRSGGAVYTQRPAPAPAPMVAKETAAPPPATTVAPLAAPSPAKVQPAAKPAVPQATVRLAKKPAASFEKAAAVGLVRPEPTAPAQKPATAPPVVQVTATPRPEPIVTGFLIPDPAEGLAPAPPTASKESAGAVVPMPAAPTPTAARLQEKAQTPADLFEKAAAVLAVRIEPDFGSASAVAAMHPTHPIYLTCAELVGTAIEVRNGTWTRNLAHKTRTRLNLEGFTVDEIGNHIDFGATKTIIYYRPGVERVARVLNRTFFPMAKLSQSNKLKNGMDIKILLGADLKKQPQVMACLAGEG